MVHPAPADWNNSRVCKRRAEVQAPEFSSVTRPSRPRRRSALAACSRLWYCERMSTKPSPTSYPCLRRRSRPCSPRVATTSRILLSGPNVSGTGRGLDLLEDHPVAVPLLRHAGGVVAEVAELQAPHPFDLDGRRRELQLGVLALHRLEQGHAVQDERAWKVDRVDATALARAVDAGRARAERVDHR